MGYFFAVAVGAVLGMAGCLLIGYFARRHRMVRVRAKRARARAGVKSFCRGCEQALPGPPDICDECEEALSRWRRELPWRST